MLVRAQRENFVETLLHPLDLPGVAAGPSYTALREAGDVNPRSTRMLRPHIRSVYSRILNCASSAVDIHTLLAERRHLAEQLRSTLTCLGILRAQCIRCLTDEARHHLLCAINQEAGVCRNL